MFNDLESSNKAGIARAASDELVVAVGANAGAAAAVAGASVLTTVAGAATGVVNDGENSSAAFLA